MVFYISCFPAKSFIYNIIRDIWFEVTVMLKRNSLLVQFIDMNGNGGYKFSHYPFYRIQGNTPDAEKPKNMINTEGIKVFAHLLKTLTPPRKTIFLHFFPVIGWESPVLPFDGKIIRW